jgi:ubiquitin thioesterase protein OTUB1
MNRSNVVEEIARIRSFGCLVEAAGNVESWLYEKTAGETINFLKDLHNSVNCTLQSRADLLMRRFNDTKISNAIIFHLRLISSLWAAEHAQTYEGLIPDGVSLDEYRKKTLEAHNGQLDILGAAILVDWLLNPMGIKLNIVTLGGKGLFTTLDEHLLTTRFAQFVSSVGTCHLLYRFDHYDILYTQDYSGIDGNGGTSMIFFLSIFMRSSNNYEISYLQRSSSTWGGKSG